MARFDEGRAINQADVNSSELEKQQKEMLSKATPKPIGGGRYESIEGSSSAPKLINVKDESARITLRFSKSIHNTLNIIRNEITVQKGKTKSLNELIVDLLLEALTDEKYQKIIRKYTK